MNKMAYANGSHKDDGSPFGHLKIILKKLVGDFSASDDLDIDITKPVKVTIKKSYVQVDTASLFRDKDVQRQIKNFKKEIVTD